MKRCALALLAATGAGCGRWGFDAASSATTDGDVASDSRTDGGIELAQLLVGCKLHLAMDEAAWTGAPGEVRDSCGTNHGTAQNGATTALDPQRGRVGAFIGDPTCVQVPNAPALRMTTALTASAWIKPAGLASGSYGILSKRRDFGASTEYSVFVWTDANGSGTKNALYVDIDTENNRLENPVESFGNTWRQVTVVYDGSLAAAERIRFYIDGVFSFAGSEDSDVIPLPNPVADLSVGCLPLSGPAQSMNGLLDEVILWARPLDATEVRAWYEATRSPL